VPAFTVLFGSSSVGKTALLRQVLSDSDKYHVLHFDLRIAGFADLSSLYFSLSQQLESYFAVIPEQMGSEWGWDEFEKESWAFKVSRKTVLRQELKEVE
jgi:AAA+ ATPase superfamily predicted ATPase